jgi:hypothetical protein
MASVAPAVTRNTEKPTRKTPKSQTDEDRSRDGDGVGASRGNRNSEASSEANSETSRSSSREKTEDADASEATSKDDQEGTSSAKKALRKVASQMKSQGQDPGVASPILGILAGKASAIPLESVPEIIVTNPFVVRALGEDVSQYLSTPQSLQYLSNSLDLSDEVLDRAKEMGVDPLVAISPKDLFMALGIDSQKISSELIRIRERGPMEGLASIINSLKKSSLPGEGEIPSVAGRPVIRTKEELLRATEVAQRANSMDASKLTTINSGRSSGLTSDLDSPFEISAQTKETSDFSLTESLQAGNVNLQTFVNDQGSSSDAETSPLVDKSIFVRAERSLIDPYDAMSLQMADVQHLNLEDKNALTTPLTLTTQDGSLKHDLTGEVLRLRLEEGAPGLSGRSFHDLRGLKNADASDAVDLSLAFSKETFQVKDSSSLDAALSSSIVAGFSEESRSFESDREDTSDLASGKDEPEAAGSSNPNHSHSVSPSESMKSKFQGLVEGGATSSSSQASSIREMIDKAQMHLDKNGGSMRIEMGGENPVSLAIRVQDNEVSLKVSTQSDAMRDLISSEISRLQDSLSNRNLRLTEVDLGRQTFSSSHEGQRQNPGQGFLDFGSGSNSRQNPFRESSRNQLPEVNEAPLARVGDRLRNDLGKLLVRV